jgi:hypothetical protein
MLAITVFGFVANSALAMEKLNKITDKDTYTAVYLKRGSSLRYIDTVNPVVLCQKHLFFLTRWKLEKDLTENNFVFCNLHGRKKAIVCGTKNKQICNDLEMLLAIKGAIASIPYDDPETYDSRGRKYDGGY